MTVHLMLQAQSESFHFPDRFFEVMAGHVRKLLEVFIFSKPDVNAEVRIKGNENGCTCIDLATGDFTQPFAHFINGGCRIQRRRQSCVLKTISQAAPIHRSESLHRKEGVEKCQGFYAYSILKLCRKRMERAYR